MRAILSSGGPLFDAITVKCFRIWQSAEPANKCNDIGIVRGYVDGNDWFYDVVQVFHAVSGGGWARPVLAKKTWEKRKGRGYEGG